MVGMKGILVTVAGFTLPRTSTCTSVPALCSPLLYRRNLNVKGMFQAASSHVAFKR